MNLSVSKLKNQTNERILKEFLRQNPAYMRSELNGYLCSEINSIVNIFTPECKDNIKKGENCYDCPKADSVAMICMLKPKEFNNTTSGFLIKKELDLLTEKVEEAFNQLSIYANRHFGDILLKCMNDLLSKYNEIINNPQKLEEFKKAGMRWIEKKQKKGKSQDLTQFLVKK